MIKLQDILLEMMLGEDRCKRIADRRYSKPSAYKSGAIVRCRKGKIWKGLKENNQPSEESYQQALKDIKPIIPVLSHNLIHQQGLEHNEENMVKLNQKIFDLVKNGDDNTLDQLWDLAGNSLLRNAINIITFYHKSLNELGPRDIHYQNILDYFDKADSNIKLQMLDLFDAKSREELISTLSEMDHDEAVEFEKELGIPLFEGKKETLRTWFKRKGAPGKTGGWVDCNTCREVNGKTKCKPCGRQKGEKRAKYPSCRPTVSACKQPGKGKKWGKTK